MSGGRWSWVGQPKEIHTDVEFAMNEVLLLLRHAQGFMIAWTMSLLAFDFLRSTFTGWSILICQEYSYCWAGQTIREIASYKPDMSGIRCLISMMSFATYETGLLLVGRVGERVVKTDMTVTKNFLVMVFHQLLCPQNILEFKTQILVMAFSSVFVFAKIFWSAGKLCRRLNTKTLQAQEQSASSQEPKRLPSSDKKGGKTELILSWKNENITYFTPHDIL